MNRVIVEFPMWLGRDLGPDWESPGISRARLEADAPEGTTVRQLLVGLTERYPVIGTKVLREHQLAPYTIAILNQRGVNRDEVMDMVLSDGDVLTVMLIVVGG
ncbi:MAG: MoaD/ThiS family protein [Chloroflexota bacterium]